LVLTIEWMSASTSFTGWRMLSARSVGSMPRGPRSSSGSPNVARSRRSVWLSADWVMPSFSAARETLLSSTSTSKETRRLRSIDFRFIGAPAS